MSTRKTGGYDLTALQGKVSPCALGKLEARFVLNLFLHTFSEGKFELEKCNKSFTLLPREFVGSLVDKFLNGALANKAWPHGALTVGEVGAEYSYLGGESIARCCKYKGFVLNQWMDRQMSKDLYAGALGLVYCVCGWL